MHVVLQDIISGVGLGAIYGLAGLGINLVFRSTRVVNFAVGALSTVVALTAWTLHYRAGLGIATMWIISMIAAFFIGCSTEWCLLRRMRLATPLGQTTMTLGLLLLLEGGSALVWGVGPKQFPAVVPGSATLPGGYGIDLTKLAAIGAVIVLSGGIYVVQQRTRIGLALRAAASNEAVAELMGIRGRRLILIVWGLGTMVATVGALMVAPTVGLSPNYFDNLLLYTFVGVVLGGLGSITGAVVGGFIVGAASNLIVGYLSAELQLPLLVLFLVAVLYVRPNGVFGVPVTERQ